MACIQHVSAVRWRFDELNPDAQVLLVAFSDSDELGAYALSNDLPFVILQDFHQSAYRTYGLAKGTFTDLFGLTTLRRYMKILRRDGKEQFRAPVEDWQQLGGDFVIAPDGTLSYGYWSSGPGDRPSFETLQDELDAVSTAVL